MSDELLQIYVAEYEKLKDETIARIGFRDNLIYVNLAAIGAIISFAITDTSNYASLLIIPWVGFILGWTYLVNDEKISQIGQYFRSNLLNKVEDRVGKSQGELFGWEFLHRNDARRFRRKFYQLLVDLITFCFSGYISIGAFWFLAPDSSGYLGVITAIEILLLSLLVIEIIQCADFRRGN